MAKEKRPIGSVQDLGDGKYHLRVSADFDDFGRRIQPSKIIEAKSAADAERQLLKFYTECQRGAAADKDAPKTLGELYKEFDAYHARNPRPTTQNFYSERWDKRLKKYENTKLESCTPKNIRKMTAEIEAGDRTKKGVYGMLKTMFKVACVDNSYMASNPCEKAASPKYKAPEKTVLSREELSEVFTAVQTKSSEQQLSVPLAAVCAMRRGEIMALARGRR